MKRHVTILAMIATIPALASDPFIAHEWGTFTSVAGRVYGAPLEWAPLSGSPDLPCFVERLKLPATKYSPATVRMETPVMFFYAKQALTLTVAAQFPQGWMTDWYPKATKVYPITTDVQFLKNGGLEWSGVRVLPGSNAALASTNGDSRYYAARNTDAAPIEVGGQTEKMIFYRGVGTQDVPLRPRYKDGKIEIRNTGAHTVPLAILFENHEGQISYRVIGSIEKTVTVDAPEMNGNLDALRQDLIGRLVEFGLYKKEAEAMIETWRDSWFEEGTRVLQIVPRAQVDEWVPLHITPAPGELTRVYVGRIEMLSPGTRATIEKAAQSGDTATLQKFGRFLDTFVQQMGARYSNVLNIVHRGDPAACVQ